MMVFFLGGHNGMKQMYELKKMVTVSELWISNLFQKTYYVSIVHIQPKFKKKSEVSAEKKVDGTTLVTPWAP